VKWVCLHCTFALNVMSLPISEFSSYHCNITRRLSKIYVLWNRHLLKWTLNQNNPVDTGCSTKHDSSKTTWRSSLIFDTCCIFCQPNLRNKILEYNYLKIILPLAFPKCGLPFFAFNITRDMKNFAQISTILILFYKVKSEQNSYYCR